MSENLNNNTGTKENQSEHRHHSHHHRHHSSHSSSQHSSHKHSSHNSSSGSHHHHKHSHRSEQNSDKEENTFITAGSEATAERNHKRRHHSSQHGSHHHSHHSSGSHKKSRSKKKFSKLKAFFKKLSDKLTLKKLSSRRHIKKIASSTKKDKRKEYAIISKRVLFGVAIITLFSYTFWYMTQDHEDTDIKTASYTPSETSQLKIQVMQLQQENKELLDKLNKYIALYGELEEDETSSTQKETE